MSNFERQKELVKFLKEKTDEGKIEWSQDLHGEPIAKLKGHYVKIEEGRSASGSTLLFIVIMDDSKVELESFNDEDLDSGSSDSFYFRLLKGLHGDARRKATGADAALDSILKSLKDL